MVDSTVNRHSSMDVILESQAQLVSRIGLATKNSNKLSFLHGEIGVGKSHVANLLQQNLLNVHTVKLQLKNAIEPEQLKQQIICELATDELSDLNQSISTAVHNSIRHKNISTLLIIDNAELIPQQALNALWQSIHELTRMNQTHFTFNVLLIGASRWAFPVYSGLKNKTDSLVAEYSLTALTKQQAIDFMMNVHADWSDLKIQQFINKVAPEYLTPKQLIYAQLPLVNSYKKKILLGISLIVLLLISVAIVGSISSEKSESIIDSTEVPNFITPLAPVNPSEINEIKVEATQTTIVEDITIITPTAVTSDVIPVETIVDDISIVASDKEATTEANSTEIQTPNRINETQEPITIVVNEQSNSQETIDIPMVSTYQYDEQYLLNVPTSHYALMLGGYSNKATLLTMQTRFKDRSKLYQYETIRYQQAWFVFLYGTFETLEQANKFVKDNKTIFEGFSPWAKPLRSIQQEIEVSQ